MHMLAKLAPNAHVDVMFMHARGRRMSQMFVETQHLSVYVDMADVCADE